MKKASMFLYQFIFWLRWRISSCFKNLNFFSKHIYLKIVKKKETKPQKNRFCFKNLNFLSNMFISKLWKKNRN